MAKRQASNPEDDPDFSEQEETSAKRARVEEDDDMLEEETEEQKEFEARYGEDLRATLEQRYKTAGVSTSWTIWTVRCLLCRSG